MSLRISDELTLPLDAATQTFAFLARRGGGKTYAASKLCEEMIAAGIQVVVLDPVGNWYGLRLAADGKGKGFGVPVLGGDHGDIPLEAGAGALVADLLVGKQVSVVLDVSTMRKNQRKEFATAFAEELFHRKKSARSPMHLFIEEAQVFVPQKAMGADARMLGAFEDIVKLGRNYGIGATLISQRPQSVNKDALNQTEALFVLQTNGAQERKALEAWIVEQGLDVRGLVDELPSLPVGTAYVWSPSWLGITKKVRIAAKRTYDASATPNVGAQPAAPPTLAPVDLKAIELAMREISERAEENNAARLRRRIAELEKALQGKEARPKVEVKTIEVPAVSDTQIEELRGAVTQMREHGQAMLGVAERIASALDRVGTRTKEPSPSAPRLRVVSDEEASDSRLSSSQQNILDMLSWAYELRISPMHKSQLAAFAGQSPTSSGYANNLGRLRSLGLIDYIHGKVVLTASGQERAMPPQIPPTSEAIQERVYGLLSNAQARILRELVALYPDDVSKADLAVAAEQSPSSSGYANNLGRLRTLGFIDYPRPGRVTATPLLFLAA
jgi:hypothetical protein